jgi:8-oxo-dGTP pyrophosphatase MutT (NUDIX family)
MRTKHHETAGGVVMDQSGRMLVIVRDIEREGRMVHEVRLPKGHIDPGETAEQAALREVEEESGYGALEIIADLGSCHSTFDFRGRQNERDERYFLMRLTDPRRGAPRPTGHEEALFQPDWIDPAEAATQLSYESEREFARRAIEALRRAG